MINVTIFTVVLIVGGVTLLKHFIQKCGKNDDTYHLIENNNNDNDNDIPPSYNEINNNDSNVANVANVVNGESPPSY